ncbi:hypothetical protein K449DRAFT_384891 [Hypoxylon sp. EC38]|nr:hypothetical protein K449DRAFT_384891 [Hypoxylon sp. EC38]
MLRAQIRFKDPRQEWKLVNAWFVKQNNFHAMFEVRDLVKPDSEKEISEKLAST